MSGKQMTKTAIVEGLVKETGKEKDTTYAAVQKAVKDKVLVAVGETGTFQLAETNGA